MMLNIYSSGLAQVAIFFQMYELFNCQYELCPKREEIFNASIVSGYKNGYIHHYCLIAKFTNEYLENYIPEKHFPFKNPNGHLFFIKPTWKTNKLPTGCVSNCRLFNPIAPFSTRNPQFTSNSGQNVSYVEYSPVNDALEFPSSGLVNVGVDLSHKRITPDCDPCSYINFSIDTSSIADRVVRYAFTMSKILCWTGNGEFATLELQQGMNVSESGITDCPDDCDCTLCPPTCSLGSNRIMQFLNEQCQDICTSTTSLSTASAKSKDTTLEVTTSKTSASTSATEPNSEPITSSQSCICAFRLNCGKSNGLCYFIFIVPLILFGCIAPAIYLFILLGKKKQRSERTVEEITNIIVLRKRGGFPNNNFTGEMKHIERILRINGISDPEDLLKQRISTVIDKVFSEQKVSDEFLSKALYAEVSGILRENMETPHL